MSQNRADRAALEIIAHEHACQILASRVDMMPGSIDQVDRLKRRQGNLVAQIRNQAVIGAGVHFKRLGEENVPAEALDETAAKLAAMIGLAIQDATETELFVDRLVAEELSKAQA